MEEYAMVQGLGERLMEQRVLRKLSQKEVAIAVGVSVSVISNYEHGERTPSVETLMSLAGLYRCSTDYLLGIDKLVGVGVDVSMLSEKQVVLLQEFLGALKD